MSTRDVACLGAFITIVSVLFSTITQNVLNTYTSLQDGRMVDLRAGRVARSEYWNQTAQPQYTELNLGEFKSSRQIAID